MSAIFFQKISRVSIRKYQDKPVAIVSAYLKDCDVPSCFVYTMSKMQPVRLLRHSRSQELFDIIECCADRRRILSVISCQKLVFGHLEERTFIDFI